MFVTHSLIPGEQYFSNLAGVAADRASQSHMGPGVAGWLDGQVWTTRDPCESFASKRITMQRQRDWPRLTHY